MKYDEWTEILVNSIVRETEKAILFSFCVSWSGNCHSREIWVPKSCVRENNGRIYDFKTWFVNKLESQNTFHGYVMCFEGKF